MKLFFQKYQTYILLITLIVIPLFGILPLLHTGFFPMHDDEQVGRLIELHKVILDGQIPPRWVPDLGFGYGYPLYNFYPPLFYYVGVIFSLLGAGYIVSTKIALILGFIASAVGMYLWVENRWGKLAGIFSAVVYTYVPYHAVDIYVRGAFSEFFSFVFIPFTFWAMDKVTQSKEKKWIIILSLLLSGIVLTHNLVALQAIPFILLYIGFLLLENRKDIKRLLIFFSVAGLVSLGITAYFWLPALSEKQFTLVDSILTKELANYTIHFVCPNQLWSSSWGYGGSAAGCVDGLSFQIGKLQILFVALAAIGLLFKKSKGKIFVAFILVLFTLSAFMTTDYSKFIWDHLSPFWYIQFPWRFLLFVGVFSSALAGFTLSYLLRIIPRKLSILLLVALSFLFMYQVRHDFVPQRYMHVGDDHYLSNIKTEVSRMSYEYVPKEVATQKSTLGTTELAISTKDVAKSTYTVISGHMTMTQEINKSQDKKYAVFVSQKGILQINTYSFPGWKVIVDDQKVSYNDSNRLHLIQVTLNPGRHKVEVILADTKPRMIGNLVSLISLIGVTISSIVLIKKKYEKTNS